MMSKEILVTMICICLVIVSTFFVMSNANNTIIRELTLNEYVEVMSFNTKEKNDVTIEMNFAGDCTLGTDTKFTYANQFTDVYNKEQRAEYFFENMQELFSNDDLTIVNLEGTFTDSKNKTPKEYNFKGPPYYANILPAGSVEAVNIANNHIKDYGVQGYEDTVYNLKEYGVNYFGYDNYYIYEKENIKIGFAGLTSISDGTINKRIDDAISFFEENGCKIKIFSFHWGIEREYKQNANQRKVAQYAIDKGADLVVGHHPHVLQGIEKYNGKYIVYSLGNFCFGGNTYVPDKDTMVFNIVYRFEEGELAEEKARIYPAKVSSLSGRNDYKPTLAVGEDYKKIINKVLKNSNVSINEEGIIN